MPHRVRVRTLSFAWSLVFLGGTLQLVACDKDKLKGPDAEVKKTDVKMDLPAVPAFDLPAPPGDGSHSVKELRVKGKKLFDSEVTVHGYITWAYDCMTAVRKPDESDKDLKKRLEDDPTQCERAKFYIGDTKETPAEKSLWIVDVPRRYNKLEIERLPKEELKNPPLDRCDADFNTKDPKKRPCPPYTVGDEVTITGDFKLSSPHSERNSDGLLVYKKMKNTTQAWDSPVIEPPPGGPTGAGGAPAAPTAPPAGSKPSPEDLVKGKKTHG